MPNFATRIPDNIWVKTPSLTIKAAGTTFAYRRLGPAQGVPVVLLNHWGANLDNFDPRIVDGLAQSKPVYALDYRGVGNSGGEAPLTVAQMADDIVAVIAALKLDTVDLIGFSLGGFVAQQIILSKPKLVRKLVLAGTGPAGGPGIERVGKVSWPLILKGLLTLKDPKTYLFFTSTQNGRQAAKAFLLRLKERKTDRDASVTPKVFLRQLKAITAWGRQPAQNLISIASPVLIANGHHDIMVPSENSTDMARRVPAADLVLYPDAGHGGIFQYHEDFLQRARTFLAA